MRNTETGRHRQKAAREQVARHVFYTDGEKTGTPVVQAVLQRLGLKVTHFGSAHDCLAGLRTHPCHLLISNARKPAVETMDLLSGARGMTPPVPVVVLVDQGDIQAAVQVMKGGAVDCLERPPQREPLTDAIDAAMRESVRSRLPLQDPLTRTEKQVLQVILQGHTTAETARLLHRSARTIEVHRSHIMHKLRVSSMVDLVRVAAAMGLLDT